MSYCSLIDGMGQILKKARNMKISFSGEIFTVYTWNSGQSILEQTLKKLVYTMLGIRKFPWSSKFVFKPPKRSSLKRTRTWTRTSSLKEIFMFLASCKLFKCKLASWFECLRLIMESLIISKINFLSSLIDMSDSILIRGHSNQEIYFTKPSVRITKTLPKSQMSKS